LFQYFNDRYHLPPNMNIAKRCCYFPKGQQKAFLVALADPTWVKFGKLTTAPVTPLVLVNAETPANE
jgi:hypothetical protein